MTPRGSARRGGFTLLEMLIVVGLMVLLAALAAGTFYRVQAGQKVSATEATESKLNTGLDRRWKAVLDDAADDVKNSRVHPLVVQLAGGDKDRTRAIWTYLLLRNEFPTTAAEAGDVVVTVPGGSTSPVLKGRQVFAPVVQAVAAGTAAAATIPPERVSAALLYLALTQTGTRGETFSLEGIENQVAEVELWTGGTKFRMFVDTWGQPIPLVRLGYSSELDGQPYAKQSTNAPNTAAKLVREFDSLDPLGKLPTIDPFDPSNPTAKSWSEGHLAAFWAAAGDLHWKYPGFPQNKPVNSPSIASLNTYPFTVTTQGQQVVITTRNPTPTLVSAGPNKRYYGSNDLLEGIDDESKDNILSFRLRKEGSRGD